MLKKIAAIYAQSVATPHCETCAYKKFFEADADVTTEDFGKDLFGCGKTVEREITRVALAIFMSRQAIANDVIWLIAVVICGINCFPSLLSLAGLVGVYLVGSMYLVDARNNRIREEIKKGRG